MQKKSPRNLMSRTKHHNQGLHARPRKHLNFSHEIEPQLRSIILKPTLEASGVATANEYHVLSTDVYRTIQSAYAEITGVLQLGRGKGKVTPLSDRQAKAPENRIPFKVRRAS